MWILFYNNNGTPKVDRGTWFNDVIHSKRGITVIMSNHTKNRSTIKSCPSHLSDFLTKF